MKNIIKVERRIKVRETRMTNIFKKRQRRRHRRSLRGTDSNNVAKTMTIETLNRPKGKKRPKRGRSRAKRRWANNIKPKSTAKALLMWT